MMKLRLIISGWHLWKPLPPAMGIKSHPQKKRSKLTRALATPVEPGKKIHRQILHRQIQTAVKDLILVPALMMPTRVLQVIISGTIVTNNRIARRARMNPSISAWLCKTNSLKKKKKELTGPRGKDPRHPQKKRHPPLTVANADAEDHNGFQ